MRQPTYLRGNEKAYAVGGDREEVWGSLVSFLALLVVLYARYICLISVVSENKMFNFSFRFHSQCHSFIDNTMSFIYFLKVEVEDVGNSLDASSSDLNVIKVNGNQFFFTNKKA